MQFEQSGFKSNRAGLTIAVIGLSITTVIVLWVGSLFVSSLMLWWQPAFVVALPLEQEPEVQTAVSQVTNPVVESKNVFTLSPQPTRFVVESESEVEGGAETAVSAPITNLPSSPQIASSPAEEAIQYGELIIPSLEVNQLVTNVPLRDGEWDITALGADIGQLALTGAYPGDDLAMNFIGHVTLPWPGVGPFADLILLERGEEVIYRWNGMDYIYEVERIFKVNPSNVGLLYESGGDRINLVTCSGWDITDLEYAKRLVTRAVLVRTEPSPVKLEQ